MSKSFTTSKKPTISRLRKEAEAIAKGTKLGEMKADLKKPIEESLKEHIGNLIDHLDPIETSLYVGLAYLGYETTKNWKGALIGPICFRLAQSPNEIASVSGMIGLAGLGLITIAPSVLDELGLNKPLDYTITIGEICQEGYTKMHDWKSEICVLNYMVLFYELRGWTKGPLIGAKEEEFVEMYYTHTDAWRLYMVFEVQADKSRKFVYYLGRCEVISSARYGRQFTDWSKEIVKRKIEDSYAGGT